MYTLEESLKTVIELINLFPCASRFLRPPHYLKTVSQNVQCICEKRTENHRVFTVKTPEDLHRLFAVSKRVLYLSRFFEAGRQRLPGFRKIWIRASWDGFDELAIHFHCIADRSQRFRALPRGFSTEREDIQRPCKFSGCARP